MKYKVEFVAGEYMVIRYIFSGIIAVCARDRGKYYGVFKDMRTACEQAAALAKYNT